MIDGNTIEWLKKNLKIEASVETGYGINDRSLTIKLILDGKEIDSTEVEI